MNYIKMLILYLKILKFKNFKNYYFISVIFYTNQLHIIFKCIKHINYFWW